MKCIYCRTDIGSHNKSDEHVFPRAFGCPDTWTLDCVCKDCNTLFGQTIERYLASDSLEGLWRLRKIGSRSKKHISQTRIKLTVPDELQYQQFRGATVYLDFSKKDTLYLPPQIMLKDEEGKRLFFLIEDLEKGEPKSEIRKYKNKPFWIFAHNSYETEIALKRLKRLGIPFKPEKEARIPQSALDEQGSLKIKIDGIIDSTILRAIAKISFNYLAKIIGGEYLLDSRFDAIRNYIKNGVKPNFELVKIKKGHILADETDNQYFFEGHIFIIQIEGKQIIGLVSLSNTLSFHYKIELGEIGLILYPLKSGHAYSLNEKQIVEVFSPTLIEVPKLLRKSVMFKQPRR